MLTLNDGRSELWQWDTGRKLTVDADCSQVHFSNKIFGRSIDVNVVDGVATIPDIMLQTDKDFTAWAFVGTPENGYTKISKAFKVNRRNKPADYVFTPHGQTTLGEIVQRLEELEAMQDPDAIKNAVEDYLEQNPVEVPVQSVNGQTGAVELNAEDVGAISQDDLQEATNEVLAQAKASGEFDGKDGEPGKDGQDGKTPIKGEDYFTHDEIQEIAEQAAEMVGVPSGEWKKIGNFTAADNINPWIIDTDEDGEAFACTEFRIRAKLCFFQNSANPTVNRSILLYGNDGKWVPIAIDGLKKGFAEVIKGDDVTAQTATFKNPSVIDITTHCGLVVAETLSEASNNSDAVMLASTYRNRGVPHTADYFTQIKISLGFATNLIMAGSTLEIWGR